MDRNEQIAMRTWLGRTLSLGLGFSPAGPLIHVGMAAQTKGRILRRVEDVPFAHWVIVLGARAYRDGRPSPVLADRLLAARDLWRAGKVERILLSGDAAAVEGDECMAMRRFLLHGGVSAEALVEDGLGIRSLETMLRARQVFGIESAILCTQAFHLPRSLYLARRAGLSAWGLVADRRVYARRHKDHAREYLARQLAFVDCRIWGRQEPEM